MNWTLPLLFILLSPGFLISLGSKSKISIITILIHALIFAIIINVYGPDLEGFQSGQCSDGSSPTVSCPDGTTPKIPACDSCCSYKSESPQMGSQDKPAAPSSPTLLNPSDFVREINNAVSRFVPVIPPNTPASMIDSIKSSAPIIEDALFNGATTVTNNSITQTILNGILKAYPANSNIVCSSGNYCRATPGVSPNPPACPKCSEVPPNNQSAASKFCGIM